MPEPTTTTEITKAAVDALTEGRTINPWYEHTRLSVAEKEQLQQLGDQYQMLQAAADFGLGELLKKAQEIAGNEFDSWAQAVLGLTAVDTRRIIKSAQIQARNKRMLEWKLSGMTWAEVAEKEGVPADSVQQMAKSSCDRNSSNTLPLQAFNSRAKVPDEDLEEIVGRLSAGEHRTAVASDYGCSQEALSAYLQRHGIGGRSPKTVKLDSRISELAAAGLNQYQIAAEVDKSQAYVGRRLKAVKARAAREAAAAEIAETTTPATTTETDPDMATSRKLTEEMQKRLIELHSQGLSQRDIGKELGISATAAGNYIRRSILNKADVSAYIERPTTAGEGKSVKASPACTPPLGLFMEEGHELNVQMEHYKEKFIAPLAKSIKEMEAICQRMDRIHNMLLDDLQKSPLNMRIRWTAYEYLWRDELNAKLDCDDFLAIQQRVQNSVRSVEKKVRHALADLKFERGRIQITP
jgi:predicted transcriptional regulator